MNEYLAKKYNVINDVFGFPQEYKGLLLYPLILKNYNIISLFNKYMTYPKHTVPIKEVLKMSYIRFIIGLFSMDATTDVEKDLIMLLETITKKEVIFNKFYRDMPILIGDKDNFNGVISIGDIDINETEFDELREIILEQNGLSIDWVNEYHPEMENHLSKMMSENPISIEDQIMICIALIHKDPKDIAEWTMYQMQHIFDRLVTLKQFEIFRPMVDKDSIKQLKNYIYHHTKKGRYDDIKISEEAFREKYKDL